MNWHNFRQFNPNCYKKHLSPLGRNVLDSLIRHRRTGCDNNEIRHRQQLTTNQNRRNTSECYGTSRSVLSTSSSLLGDAICERQICHRTNNDHAGHGDHILPKVPVDQVFDPPTLIDETDYGINISQATHFNNEHLTMPRIPVDQTPKPSTSRGKSNYEIDVRRAKQKDNNNDIVYQRTDCGLTSTAVPVADELVKTVEISNTNEEEILTANNKITPVINFHKVNENLLSSRKYTDRTVNHNIPPKKFLEILNNGAIDQTIATTDEVIRNREAGGIKDVGWDDMFDTELFPDLRGPQMLLKPFKDDRGNFKIEFYKNKKKNLIISDNKVKKRKNQTKITDTIQKKVKKAISDTENTSKTNFKKVKNRKSVNNWLNDVNPNNLVEDDIDQCDFSAVIQPNMTVLHEINVEKSKSDYNSNSITNNEITFNDMERKDEEKTTIKTSETKIHMEELVGAKEINEPKTSILDETVTIKVASNVEIEKKPKGKSKKVVQARLAQKDGKMKYGPPVKGQNENKPEVTIDNETKKIKEKKVKSKFVAPIKSQIPLKNVIFDVNTIDESNFHLLHGVLKSDENEIIVILIYSNGFSQLNSHHTEETCAPEGIMIQSRDKYFYSKDMQNSDLIRKLLEKFHVICYNAKSLLIHLSSKCGIELKQDVFNLCDVKIGGALIEPDNPPENFAELQKLLGFTPEYTIATECVLQKAAWYITLLRECFGKLKCYLTENAVWSVFVDIEMRLLPVIAGMEYRGVRVDVEKLKAMENILLTKMMAVEQECYNAAGKTFQINSTLQVRTILYDELQLDMKSNLKIKETISKGAKSTSETMLRGLISVHPLPRLILEYRHLHKAHATFLTGISQHVKDGTVKPTWVQTAAATGRIASNNPNLQAIPKAPFSLVMFPENSDDQEPQLNFRSVYTARPRHRLVAADFKHVECRVFAHAAQDVTLLDALRSGQDLFKVLAAKWLNKPVDEVSTEDRERTKRIVYASLYGAGARKLMEILHVGYEQALSVMSSFNRTFPALKSFGRAVVARAVAGALHTLHTLCGRARRFPHVASAHAALRAHAERQAVNFVVQGSAADLCKKAMVEVQRRLEEQPPVQGHLVLQIHDELVWEVADDDVDRAAAIIKEVMENVGRQCGMATALPVELTCGRSWGDLRPLGAGPPPPGGPDI